MKRYVLFALAGALGYAAYRAAKVYPIYSGPNQLSNAIQNGINPTNPYLYASAAAGVVTAWVLK